MVTATVPARAPKGIRARNPIRAQAPLTEPFQVGAYRNWTLREIRERAKNLSSLVGPENYYSIMLTVSQKFAEQYGTADSHHRLLVLEGFNPAEPLSSIFTIHLVDGRTGVLYSSLMAEVVVRQEGEYSLKFSGAYGSL